ncbi:MFS transporter [Streptomyces polyrhachis]|uniref:MFS transporter n=1 Tax=Streptomyces polyrhachis TaxID=1282885 RepID=A0ABW2GD14_9ACTN
MRTYRQLLATPQFTPLLLLALIQSAATTVGVLALGTLVFRTTDSPLLSALSMFGAAFAQLLGATFLMSAADRLPPRAALCSVALVFAAGEAALAVPGLPPAALFGVLLVAGAVGSVGTGVRLGLLADVLPAEGYVLGRSVLNMANSTMQVGGFALGGVLLQFLPERTVLLLCSGLYAASALLARCGLRRRAARAAGRPSVRETWRVNAVLWSSAARRYVLLASWVPNGLVVGCEALFVSYAPGHAGVLYAAAAAGMFAGYLLVGRFLTATWRERLAAPLRLLLAVPYLVFLLHPSAPLAASAAALASVGFSATLLLQERLAQLTPPSLTGQTQGLQTAGMLTMQGVGAALAGALATLLSPAVAIPVMAAASIAVTLALAPGLRRRPQEAGGYGEEVSDSSAARVAGP